MSRVRRDERGQASVEFALVLPIALSLILLVIAVGLVVRDQLLLVEATREAGRAAALDGDHRQAAAAGRSATALDPARLEFTVAVEGSYVRVVGTYRAQMRVPVLGMARTIDLRSEVVMRIEYR